MAVTSIVDIQLNDARFNNYQKLFADYEKRLAGHPKIWAQINSQIRGGVTGFNELVALETAAIGKQKLIAEAHAKAIRLTKTEAEYWRDMAHSTKTVASNIASATTSLLKWGTLTSVFTDLLGAGGLFGIERLGQAAAGGRQRGLATNTTFGEQRAFSTNFGRLVDPGMLANVNEALHTASGRASLYGAGVRDLSGNTSDVALRVLQGLKGIANATPDALLGDTLAARGLDKLISLSEFQKIKATSQGELAGLVGGFGRDRNAMGIGEHDLRLWQEFVTKLEGAGNTIESVFIRGLTPLTPGLTKLSEALTHVVEKFFGNKTSLDEIIGKAGAGLERFADYVGSDTFKNDVEIFVNGIGVIAHKISRIISFFGGSAGGVSHHPNFGHRATAQSNALKQLGMLPMPEITKGSFLDRLTSGPVNNPGNLRIPGSSVGFQQFGTEQAGVAAVARQLALYGNRDHIDTISGIISKYAPRNENDTAAYVKDVSKRTGFDPSQHIDINDIQNKSKLVAAIISHEQGRGHYDTYKNPEAVRVVIQNEAGGTIISNTRQVAQ